MDKRRNPPGVEVITERIPVALSKSDLAKLDELSRELQRGKSTIMRDAFRCYVRSESV